jgi:hypothetical protein
VADIGGEQPVEETARGLADDFDDAAIGKQCCLHDWNDLACGSLADICLAHVLVGKPVSTLPEHALGLQTPASERKALRRASQERIDLND